MKIQTRKLEHRRRFVTEFTASVRTRNLLGDERKYLCRVLLFLISGKHSCASNISNITLERMLTDQSVHYAISQQLIFSSGLFNNWPNTIK